MPRRTREDGRRVLVLGAAALVPAVIVTLLLVHQPAVGHRALAPMLRRPLAVAGLALALAACIFWTVTPRRLGRANLAGLAWAGVAALLCVGPLLQSAPRPRLFAFDAGDGTIVWASTHAGSAPAVVAGDLVVTDVDGGALVGLDPSTGDERWRHSLDGPTAPSRNVAAPLLDPRWLVPGERLLAVVHVGAVTYAYVATPGVASETGGALVKVDAGGVVRWRRALSPAMTVQSGVAALGANDDFIVVAGGERIGVLDAADGRLAWSRSVVDLGKSRSFALGGAVQQVTVTGTMVFLAVTATG